MSVFEKNFLLTFALVFVIIGLIASPVLAQAPRSLEVQYPAVPGAPAPTTVATQLPDYVKYIFNFFVWASGFIALIVLIIAGFRYLSSAGSPAILNDARDQIFAAIIGLLILFSSWLILAIINPQLTELNIPALPPVVPSLSAGIYLCKQEIDQVAWAWQYIRDIKNRFLANPSDPAIPGLVDQTNEWLKTVSQNCWQAPTSGEIIAEFNDRATFVYTVPSESNGLYGTILYEESKFGGRAQVAYTLATQVGKFEITQIRPSSVKLFTFRQARSGSYVELYELTDFNRADPDRESERSNVGGLVGSTSYIDTSDFETGSAKIEGDLIVIFFKDEHSGDWPDSAVIDVIVSTDANINDNLMGRWCNRGVYGFREYYPCPQQMVVISGGIY